MQPGGKYSKLPKVIVLSIVAYELFDDCEEFHSEFQALEVNRHTRLTEKMSLHYFELPKLPESVSEKDRLWQWLALFKASTEEELKRIEALEVPEMEQAIGAYRSITATSDFKELERLRERARHDEATALDHAWRKGKQAGMERGITKGAKKERTKWQGVVAGKDAEIARLRALLEGNKQ
jgi:predicted transposase/invertase (TIGR01784 family)